MGQTAQIICYSNLVESVKKENKTVFKDIYSVLDLSQKIKQPVSNEQLCEFKPDTNLRPAPLTFQSTLMETHHFYAQFERYVKTSNSLPDGIIYSQAAVNIDKFWLKQIEDRGFDKLIN